MKCRHCNAEIADKALICYRCGTATTEAKYKPVALRPAASRRWLVFAAIAAILLLAATADFVYTFATSALDWRGAVRVVTAALLLFVGVRNYRRKGRVR
jgi:hypothetical protein